MLRAIPPRPADTTPEAEEVQLSLIRAAPVARRLHLAFGLTATTINLARRAIARAHPAASKEERDRPFDREAAGRVRLDAIDDSPDAPVVPIASAEDTILSKLEWFHRGGEISERQWWDIVGVLKIRRDADRDYLRQWAEALGVTHLLERAFADADSPEPN